MDLNSIFKLKYDLLDKLDDSTFESPEEKEAFKKGYEAAVHLFFAHALNEILDAGPKKKAS